MNTVKFGVLSALLLVGAATSNADVTGLTARFAGGCNTSNTTGSCTIKVSASGTDLGSETVRIYAADSRNGPFNPISSRVHSLSSSGLASVRIANSRGPCFQARTGPNGNDKPDAKSRAICE